MKNHITFSCSFMVVFFALTFCQGTEENLSIDAPVSIISGDVQNGDLPEYAVDGNINKNNYLGLGPYPCTLQIDLGEPMRINKIHIFPYWDGNRYYQYFIETSDDGKKWKTTVDARKKIKPETEKGSVYEFDPLHTRFLRVTFTYNSANSSAHLVELKVFRHVKSK